MSPGALHQLVTFRLGRDQFAADIFTVERVLRYQDPTPIPDVPPWVAGVVEYQQHVVPVIDLRRRFALEPEPTHPATRILVFATPAEWVGAVVDAVLEVVSVSPSELSPPPALFRGLSADYVRAIVRRDGRLLVYLDVARLLTAPERLTLEHLPDEEFLGA
jgi:purine-binding chemotaxis protein CheW